MIYFQHTVREFYMFIDTALLLNPEHLCTCKMNLSQFRQVIFARLSFMYAGTSVSVQVNFFIINQKGTKCIHQTKILQPSKTAYHYMHYYP